MRRVQLAQIRPAHPARVARGAACFAASRDRLAAECFARSHPWLAELSGKAPDQGDRIRRFMEEGAVVDGVPVRVVELTGEPGDAVLTHPAICHCRSYNCSQTPRFMRS